MLVEVLNPKKYWFELALGSAIIGVLFYATLSGEFTLAGGGLTYPSLVLYPLCFAVTSYFLNRQGLKFSERIFYCFAAMASGVVLVELVYHYGFDARGVPSFQSFLQNELLFFGNQSSNGYFSLYWYLIILVVPFIGWKYMAINKILIAVIIFSIVVMFLWIATGYPQFFAPQWFPAYAPLINIIQKGNTSQIKFYGELFTALAKIIAIIPALLFNSKRKITGQP